MTNQEIDKNHIWHPYTQIKGAKENILIKRAEKEFIYDEHDNEYIDAISSWWVNTHGHSHPYIAQKMYEQLTAVEHVIFAGFTHPRAIELTSRLLNVLPKNQQRVFFSDNGSTAVEVGIKMALQYWHNKGEETKNKIIALEGAYHGDTFGAMSVSARGTFNRPFEQLLFDVLTLPFPTEESKEELKSELLKYAQRGDIAAIIVEPLIQGAAGMRMYSPELLEMIFSICKEHGIVVIADEVMAGFGRTGKMFATDYIETKPDIMCFSKGLTGGTLALGVTTTTNKIFDAFVSGDKLKTFFHGHSFTANPVACSAACASLELFAQQETWDNIKRIENTLNHFAQKLAENKGVANIRQTGTVLAFEQVTEETASYFNSKRDGIADHFLSKGVLLRPLGNVLYILPPYCISVASLEKVLLEVDAFLKLPLPKIS